MRASCPKCGAHVNPDLRGTDIFGPQPDEVRNDPRRYVWECVECYARTFHPVQSHEDRVEWFFDTVVPWILKAIVIWFAIVVVLQLLGVL